ncbi:MAG: hypothetical protein HY360_12710 [Verrucomicrobia bacterium]|nr:hypothetical protein [Verrucomicrobiota bacterium]
MRICFVNPASPRAWTWWPRNSKPILDEIDRVLAERYGFTAEELDHVERLAPFYGMASFIPSARLRTSSELRPRQKRGRHPNTAPWTGVNLGRDRKSEMD